MWRALFVDPSLDEARGRWLFDGHCAAGVLAPPDFRFPLE
jgi:hypothetical protein